jgi:hypothetical protein
MLFKEINAVYSENNTNQISKKVAFKDKLRA